MGLFENPYANLSLVGQVGQKEHMDLAREVVRKSLVLLKNGKDPKKSLMPLPKRMNKILVAGSHTDNMGYQCGGWTTSWQGLSGNNNTIGTPILEAIKNIVNPATEVVYSENPESDFMKYDNFSCAIIVVGELPYAELMGDNMNLTMPAPGQSTINNVCGSIQCIVVVISELPVVIEPYVRMIDALVVVWLPSTEDQGVADVLLGDYGFSDKLSWTWFRSVGQLPMNVGDRNYDPLFPFGFGITTKKAQYVREMMFEV